MSEDMRVHLQYSDDGGTVWLRMRSDVALPPFPGRKYRMYVEHLGTHRYPASTYYSPEFPEGFELKPVSDAPAAPGEAATTTEWKVTADDTFSHLHAWWTFESEAAARMWLADLDTGRYRNLKLEYRTIHRSVWVAEDV